MTRLLCEVTKRNRYGIEGATANLLEEGWTCLEIRYVLKHFEKLNLNPATIPVKSSEKSFPSIAELLLIEMAAPDSQVQH